MKIDEEDFNIQVGDLFYSINFPICLYVTKVVPNLVPEDFYYENNIYCTCIIKNHNTTTPYLKNNKYSTGWLYKRIKDDKWIHQKKKPSQ